MRGGRLAAHSWPLWLVALLSARCSLLYEPAAARQCTSDADCAGQPQLSGLACDLQHGLCVSKLSSNPGGCESTEACVAQNGGRAALCRFPGTPCVALQTAECPRVSGDWRSPDVLLLGSIGPHTLLNHDGSANPVDHIERLVRAIDLGLEEWQREVPEGLFYSGRPIAMVHCDSQGDPQRAQRAMDHLVTGVEVPAVLALTDFEEAVVEQAVRAQVVLVQVESHGPAANAPRFEAGLVWRMLPPFEDQAALLAWRVSDLEQRLRAARGLDPGARLRVATWADHGAAFELLLERFRALASFNGQRPLEQSGPSYLELRNVDPRYHSQSQLDTVADVIAFAPDILVVAMADHFTSYYLPLLEAQWPPALPKPQYVATLLSQELGLLAPIVAQDDDLRVRLSGTGLYVDEAAALPLAGFQARYRSRYGHEPGRTQAGYDAWYATVLAIYSADASGPLDGLHIATHFERLQGGMPIAVAPGTINLAKLLLSGQERIELQGASSKLDWSPLTWRVEAELGLWCLSRDASGSLRLMENAGPRWSPSGITGSYACPSP